MAVAKIFENGRSQAVRLPKECRFDTDEVYAKKLGGAVVLAPKDDGWRGFLEALDMFSDDFMADGRQQGPQQVRESL